MKQIKLVVILLMVGLTAFTAASLSAADASASPATGPFSVHLDAGTYSYEWSNPGAGKVDSSGSLKADGGKQLFSPPFGGDAVLYLRKSLPSH